MKTFPARFDLPAEYCREIGRIIVRWAYLEQAVQLIVYDLLNVDEKRGRIAVDDPSVPDRFEIIADLAVVLGVTLDFKGIRTLRDDCVQEKTLRDLCAHGGWVYNPTTRMWAVQETKGSWPSAKPKMKNPPPEERHKRKKRLRPGGVYVDIDTLRGTTAKIEALISRVRELRDNVQVSLAGLRT